MSFQSGGDLCLGFFKESYNAGLFEFPQGARVLEIGCAEADWLTPMHAARPDLDLVGIDWRGSKATCAEIIQGDVLTHHFPPQSFDAIVSISAIEHIGFGGYGDPLDPDGDIHTLERVHRWVKPNGWIYLDVPYRDDPQKGKPHPRWRVYTESEIQRRLLRGAFRERARKIFEVEHADGPYIALTLVPA